MRRVTKGIRSEKSVVRRFLRCANVYSHKPQEYRLKVKGKVTPLQTRLWPRGWVEL